VAIRAWRRTSFDQGRSDKVIHRLPQGPDETTSNENRLLRHCAAWLPQPKGDCIDCRKSLVISNFTGDGRNLPKTPFHGDLKMNQGASLESR
jgi:hypothetical protein